MAPLSITACSACAGDYEDPDRTAGEPGYHAEWEGDDADDADDAAAAVNGPAGRIPLADRTSRT